LAEANHAHVRQPMGGCCPEASHVDRLEAGRLGKLRLDAVEGERGNHQPTREEFVQALAGGHPRSAAAWAVSRYSSSRVMCSPSSVKTMQAKSSKSFPDCEVPRMVCCCKTRPSAISVRVTSS